MPAKGFTRRTVGGLVKWYADDGSEVIDGGGSAAQTLFGANIVRGFGFQQAQFGGMAAARTYNDSELNSVISGSTGCVPVHSFGYPGSTAFKSFLNDLIAENRRFILVEHHEPENDTTGAAFKANWAPMRRDWRAVGGPSKILLGPNYIGAKSTIVPAAGFVSTWVPTGNTVDGDPIMDFIGYDPYDTAYKSGNYGVFADRVNQFNNVKALVGGIPWALGEIASAMGPLRTTDHSRRDKWWTDAIPLCQSNKALYACAWDQKANKNLSAGDDPLPSYVPIWGNIEAADFRIDPTPVMVGIAPGTKAGQTAYGESANGEAANPTGAVAQWKAACIASRAANGIANP